jgi:methylenetetrahydrofolate reductase (NADPH)
MPLFSSMLPPAGSCVFNTFFGTDQSLIASVQTTVEQGLTPVPHITARRFRSVVHLENTLASLQAVCGISLHTVLVLGGERDDDCNDDPKLHQPTFPDAMSVLQTGLLQAYGIKRILVAGHPEGILGMESQRDPIQVTKPGDADHTELHGAAVLFETLQQKHAYAKQHSLGFGIVTQLCLSSQALCAWLKRLRATGGLSKVPVHVGVAGPAMIKTVERFADMCGVKVPHADENGVIGLLQPQVGDVQMLDCVQMLTEIAEIADQCPDSIQSVHVFAFGGLKRACQWLHEHRGRKGCLNIPSCKL